MAGEGTLTRAFAQQRLTEAELLKFDATGNVTLLHVADIHGQLTPVYFREPSVNIGVGEARGQPPHLTGKDFLKRFGIPEKSASAYALTDQGFEALAKSYGRIGGLDRLAAVVKRVRAERGNDKVLFLDGGDTWQGSLGANRSKGQDMVDCMALLRPDAMTGHWEFTYGEARVNELIKQLGFPFLALNIRDTEWNEPAFEPMRFFEKGGVKIAVLGQAFPYTPVANPRWLMPKWSFGIREEDVRANVEKARKAGAQLVVLLSHNGFDVDRKLAARVKGIDVILTGHTHDALPETIRVGQTLLIASGSHGKFVSRLDLDVRDGAVKGFRYKLIPLFADVIKPDAEMAAAVTKARAPYAQELSRVVGRAESLLYRRGNFNGTFDQLILDALMEVSGAEIAFSPGFRWGTSVLPNEPITVEHVMNQTAITYPFATLAELTGTAIKSILEDVCDNLFNPDPYLQQGGDMVRVGGLEYTCDPTRAIGQRISNLTLRGKPLEAQKQYKVAGWAPVAEGVSGRPVWELITDYLRSNPLIAAPRLNVPQLSGVSGNPGLA